MIQSYSKSKHRASWRLLLGLLCLALVVFGSTVQVAHSHANGDLAHADCSLCATAHVVAQVVAAPTVISAAVLIAPVQSASPRLRPAAISVFALFTRPPPAVLNLAALGLA